jgi:hypothetical protein
MSPGCLASTRITLVNWLSIRGSLQLVSDLIKLFQCIAIIGKEGPLRIVEAIPLYCPHYGKWRHVCPQGDTYQKPVMASSLGGAILHIGDSIAQIRGKKQTCELAFVGRLHLDS